MKPVIALLFFSFRAGYSSWVHEVDHISTDCNLGCPGGACLFEDCAIDVKCTGGACKFVNCLSPSCPGENDYFLVLN
jgi:hypothetical protein